MNELPDKEGLLKEIVLTNELVWGRRISNDVINEWLSNFSGAVFDKKYEELLALWLLSNYVFYNEDEVKHLCRTVYREYLHRRLLADQSGSINERLERINSTSMFSSLGVRGESGGMVLYIFRTTNDIGKRDIVPDNGTIRTDTNTIVFVDDVTLSSYEESQAWKYLESEIEKYPGCDIHLSTLIASEAAIEFLATKNIEVTNAITLTNENKAFHENSNIFNLNGDHKDNAMKLAKHYGKVCCPSDPLGYSDGQHLFGFYYNVPDNTLPIIWSKNNGWKPIFERYHKNYGKTGSGELGYFI